MAIDLAGLAAAARERGPAWTCETEDLDVNLLVFTGRDGVSEHVNREVDVLVVAVAGNGVVEVDGVAHPLGAGSAVLVPRGARRSTRSAGDRFAYLTCHRRRAKLRPLAVGARPE